MLLDIKIRYFLQRVIDVLSILVRFSTPRKVLNALLCFAEYGMKKTSVRSLPIEANIDPVNICDLKCPYCRTGAGIKGRKQQCLSFDMFKECIDQVKEHLYLVSLFSHGEPFLNRELSGMIKYAKDRGIPSIVHTNLNVSLGENGADRIVSSGLCFLSISIDGATQGTYSDYRRGGDLRAVMDNIDKITKAKKRAGARDPVLIWQYLLFENNIHEVRVAYKAAREKGMRFRTVIPKVPEKERIILRNRRKHRDGRPCPLLWTTLALACDGGIVPCCQSYSPDDDLARMDEGEVKEFWNSPAFIKYREYFKRKGRGKQDKDIICGCCPEDVFWMEVKDDTFDNHTGL